MTDSPWIGDMSAKNRADLFLSEVPYYQLPDHAAIVEVLAEAVADAEQRAAARALERAVTALEISPLAIDSPVFVEGWAAAIARLKTFS